MYDWAEFRHFRYLLAILEKQGFRIAAEQLHTSQPNLTVQARQFQENASVRLFRKTKNGRIRPTETGIAFITLARFLLETREEVINALLAIERGEIRSVRFGCDPLADPKLFRAFCSMHKELLPACPIRPTHGETALLAQEVVAGVVDAAIVTLPLKHPALQIEEIRQDRLVVCLRKDDPLARKPVLKTPDLQNNISVLYHPQRHPDAHEQLLGLLDSAGIRIDEYSSASNPHEMQTLVREGHGFAIVREGTLLDPDLTTRPIAGVDWTVDTAVIYQKERHPKTIPVLVKSLRRNINTEQMQTGATGVPASIKSLLNPRKSAQSVTEAPVQLPLLEKIS